MRARALVSVPFAFLLLLTACAEREAEVAAAGGRPLIEGLGEHSMPITTRSPLAQKYFDQGMRLTYAFNHPEAIRGFEAAAKIDPECAMCFAWKAFALGPNINAPMNPAAVAPAVEAVQKAQALAGKTTPREQAWIAAIAARYSNAPDADRAALDRAFADAMRGVAKQYPDDLDAQTVFADALMNLSPWAYWTKAGEPTAHTNEIVAALEGVLAKDPSHPGANHYYIHAVEASKDPGRALPSARRLETLAPNAGHLVHMSAHTYMRVGRYKEASVANDRGASADEDYMVWCRSGGPYLAAYYPHNLHFLWASQAMEGKSAASIATARRLASKLSVEAVVAFPPGEELVPTPYFALVRFGKWDEMLAEPAPDPKLRYTTAAWHYARGMALANREKLDDARAEHAKLVAIAAEPPLQTLIFLAGPAVNVLNVASHVLAAEIAHRSGDAEKALAELESAKGIEYTLNYAEPPSWYFPVRQVQGSLLLEMQRAKEAEALFLEDLVEYPENGWSLFGLAASQRAQSQNASDAEKRFATAWAEADVTLAKPRF
jgi:tetratricopeptide (TPR) repeat protein